MSADPSGCSATYLRLLPPESFDFGWVAGFLSLRAVPSLERVSPLFYRRGLMIAGHPHTIELRMRSGALLARSSPLLAAPALEELALRMLDLGGHAEAFHEFARRDPVLSTLVERRRYVRLPQLIDPFECLIRAILGQQVSLAAAATLTDRLVRLAGEPAPQIAEQARAPAEERSRSPAQDLFCFPSPASVQRLELSELRAIGLPAARAAAVRAAARAEVDWDDLRNAGREEAERRLTEIRGVGPWTAAYVRLRALGDRDAFPASDLGVLKALRRLAAVTDARAALAHAERWRPWRAYAVLSLWELLHGDAEGVRASSD